MATLSVRGGICDALGCEKVASWRRLGAEGSLRRKIWRISWILERGDLLGVGDSVEGKTTSPCEKTPCWKYSRVLIFGGSVRTWEGFSVAERVRLEGVGLPLEILWGPSALCAVASLVLIRTRSSALPCLGGSARSAGAGPSKGNSVSGKSAGGTGSVSGPRSLPPRFFFSSFSMLRPAQRVPAQAVFSIQSPP